MKKIDNFENNYLVYLNREVEIMNKLSSSIYTAKLIE